MRVPCTAHIAVSNAFRLLGSGEPIVGEAGTLKVPASSQMPFGFWVLGNPPQKKNQSKKNESLKCLSAFGFWGTPIHRQYTNLSRRSVSNAFRLLGSGELNPPEPQ